MSEEEWRAIPGWEGLYEVSDCGQIRTVSRRVPCRGNGTILLKSRIRKIVLNRYGYPVVTMEGGGRKKILKSIHRAVVEAFAGPIPAGMSVNHRDGVKTNNHISNLEICTCKENSRHMVDVLGKMSGVGHPRSMMSEAQVLRAVELVRQGIGHDIIAAEYGVSRSAITRIMMGRNWTRITGLQRQPRA